MGMVRSRIGRVLWIAMIAGAASCGRDRQVIPLPQAGENRVALYPRNLESHGDFDLAEIAILEGGQGDDLIRWYDDLARLAPGNARVLVRGALAALAVDPESRGPAIAEGVLRALEEQRGRDPDLAWLDLRQRRLSLVSGGRPLAEAPPSRRGDLEELASRAEVFARSFQDWKGPHGATVQDALRLAQEARQALETVLAPAPGAEGVERPGP